MKNYYSIPCFWDINEVREILNFQSGSNNCISEIYGSLPNSPLPHGRTSDSVIQITRDQALIFRQQLQELDIKFTYLLNGPVSSKEIESSEVIVFLDWLLNKFKPDSITITSLPLMKMVREMDSNVGINISTITGILNPIDAKNFLSVKPRKIIPHHDVARNFKDLSALVTFCGKNNIILELLATESCLRRCPARDAHYLAISKNKSDEKFHLNCNKIKLLNPENFLLANFIRPEDIRFYNKLGVRNFKISGRSKPKGWIMDVVKAYLSESYEGNLIKLLGISVLGYPKSWEHIYIDNESLNGFIDSFPKNNKIAEEREYCKTWLYYLQNSGKFKISEKIVEQYEN